MEISSDRRTVHQCLEQKFSLPSYQREYKWETKHFQELLQDIQEAFFSNYQTDHGRSAVAKYDRYFLGTIITTPAADGQRTIVDGQQRITTLALIIAYFARMARTNPSLGISDIGTQLRRNVYGQNEFNISFDPPRKRLFELLIDHDDATSGKSLEESIETVENLDDGSKRIYELFCHADNLIGKLEASIVPFFVDYLSHGVILFEISVPGEQDGHKVFVTMNDRGLKLSPIDLLKGYLLSNIPDNSENGAAHQAWKESLNRLRALGSDEDSTFFKTWLRAQYATTSRGKQKGALPGDFEVISDAYHRWVVDNKKLLDLNTSDDFYNLLTVGLPSFVDHYVRIKECEKTLTVKHPHVFYNGARDLTLQSMVVLAAISPSDSPSEIAKKIKIVSYYLDCYATQRVVNRQDNTYNNLRDPLFDITRQIRRKTAMEIAVILNAELSKIMGGAHLPISAMYYFYYPQSDILHMLARVSDFLETQFEATNKVGFDGYIQRGRGNKTFDIEHVLHGNFNEVKDELGAENDFAADVDFNRGRSMLGSLILLSRGRNRSLQAASYSHKIGVYATESILGQTLTETFYQNNPGVATKIFELGLPLTPIKSFNMAAIRARGDAYDRVAALLWTPDELLNLAA